MDDRIQTPDPCHGDHAQGAGLPEVGADDRCPDTGGAGGVPVVAPRAGRDGPRPSARTGFEGFPTGVLGWQLERAKEDLKAAQRKTDLIRRELKRRKRKNIE